MSTERIGDSLGLEPRLGGGRPRTSSRTARPSPAVGDALRGLRRAGWVVLDEVPWPGRRLAHIDHVAVGPGGVVVIDSRAWTGDLTIAGGVLRFGENRRDWELQEAANACAQVTALLPPRYRTSTRALMVLSAHDLPPTATVRDVPVVGPSHLAAHLRGLPHRLTPADVRTVEHHLRKVLPTRRRRQVRTAVGWAARGAVALGVGALVVAALRPPTEVLGATVESAARALRD
jgi:hypothetical protein